MSESAASGTPNASPLPRPTPPAPGARSRAAVDTSPPFFEENEVSVSITRIVAYGTPASLSGVETTRLFVDTRHLKFAILILIAGICFGIFAALNHNTPVGALGFMLVVVSYLAYRFQNFRHRLYVTRETGAEAEVFVTGDLDFARRVHAAVDQALAQQAATAAPPQPTAPVAQSDAAPAAVSTTQPTPQDPTLQ
jgi:hypothetical protein